jgi:two-component system sensor histidine kinase/response regulator
MESNNHFELQMSEETLPNGTARKDMVLIVDDYPDNLTFVSELLEQNDINVALSSNGPDALEIAKKELPDLILLDISMPNMDGYEVCERLKADNSTQHIPIVFLTAKVESDDIIKGFEAGGADYITKPFNLLELLSRVNAHLELKNRHDKLRLMNSKLVDSVKKRTTQLMQANERLSKLDKTKNEFLIHINHQLRTPLNGIMGYTELLTQTNLSKEQEDFISEISKLVKRLVKLSERSLLFTELRANTYRLNIEIVKAAPAIERAILVATGRYPEKKVFINNEVVKNDFKILADENLFFRCFTILLDNAIKFSPENGVISIYGDIHENKKVLRIEDNGPGLTEDTREKLFEMFSAGDNSDKDNGFGMGLATAKLIMDIMNGEIELFNLRSGGTEARLIFSDWSTKSKY